MQLSTEAASALPTQISEQARLQPRSTALCQGDRELSYADLILRADQFAEYLRQRVGVCGAPVALSLIHIFEGRPLISTKGRLI